MNHRYIWIGLRVIFSHFDGVTQVFCHFPTKNLWNVLVISTNNNHFADAIAAPGLMRDLLGPQISLADHITLCLNVLRGKYGVGEVGGQRFLVVVSHLISGGLCPEAADAIQQHLVRAFVSEAPLDKRELDPVSQRRHLENIVQEFANDPHLDSCREELDKAIDRRRRRLRSALLRSEGLEELADQAL